VIVVDVESRRTVGVEEELLIVDPVTGVPRAVAGMLLRRASQGAPVHGDIEPELQQQQLEVATSPSSDLHDVGRQLREWRRHADALARQTGARIAALATSPLPVDPQTTIKPRYQQMVERFGLTSMEQLTCGCHVHVAIRDDDEGAIVIDRIQRWLPILLALSTNSPFWQGRDSGYASFRTQVWSRLPTAGPTERFGDAAGYQALVDRLLASGVLLDKGMIYFNARLSHHYPTVEIRVADICPRVDDAIMIAALARALVETAARDSDDCVELDHPHGEQLRLAHWQASRAGLDGPLLDPFSFTPDSADRVVGSFLDHVGPALDALGDNDLVTDGIARLRRFGTGATLQRAALDSGSNLPAVVRSLIDVTVEGVG
jgi:glutamate---cysteine ligase / carboxylate-amine ligase